jgi:predicted ester cyclase
MANTPEENKAIVRRWVKEVFNEHKLDQVEELKVHNYIDWNPYPGQDMALGGFKAVLVSFFQAFPDFRYDVEEELSEGDMLVCIGTWSGTHTGSFMGLPPTGERMSARRIDIVRFSGDKMTERWGTGNELKTMKMMGFYPPLPPLASDDPKSIVRRFIDEVFVKKNLAAIEDLADDNAVEHARNTVMLFLLSSAFRNSRVSIEHLVADGDKVTALLTFSGTHEGEFMGQPPTGAEVKAQKTITFRVAEGKIVESWYDFDLGVLAQQVDAASLPMQR